MLIKNFFGHLSTVLNHKKMVMYHCIKAGIPFRGVMHDLSKFSPSEFVQGVKYFQGFRSPNERERELTGYSAAWMHHKGRNRHHFEYWTDYSSVTGTLDPVEMPDIFIFEMFCDRVAASKIYAKENYQNNMPIDYFLKNKGKRAIHPNTSRKLEFLLRLLNEKGEDETFRYIRYRVKKMKRGKQH